jgi:hypothetical protein
MKLDYKDFEEIINKISWQINIYMIY